MGTSSHFIRLFFKKYNVPMVRENNIATYTKSIISAKKNTCLQTQPHLWESAGHITCSKPDAGEELGLGLGHGLDDAAEGWCSLWTLEHVQQEYRMPRRKRLELQRPPIHSKIRLFDSLAYSMEHSPDGCSWKCKMQKIGHI